MRFVDTNVLLYAVSTAADEAAKTAAARGILADRDLALSTQVLQEFYVQATRVGRNDRLPHDLAREFVATLGRFPVTPVTWEIVTAAMDARDRWGISYWDAAILEAARTMGCDVVLSEDLSDRTDDAGVRVVNPFADG